jgi:hypothetical protein
MGDRDDSTHESVLPGCSKEGFWRSWSSDVGEYWIFGLLGKSWSIDGIWYLDCGRGELEGGALIRIQHGRLFGTVRIYVHFECFERRYVSDLLWPNLLGYSLPPQS